MRPGVRTGSPTTEFDRLLKYAFTALFPGGSARNRFFATPGADCYRRSVMPDFVMPDGRWVDFKLHVSYREKHDGPLWKPSALYASLRKYIDHTANRHGVLVVVYGHLHGSLADVVFPVTRGRKVLLRDADDFAHRVKLVNVRQALSGIQRRPDLAWVLDAVSRL